MCYIQVLQTHPQASMFLYPEIFWRIEAWLLNKFLTSRKSNLVEIPLTWDTLLNIFGGDAEEDFRPSHLPLCYLCNPCSVHVSILQRTMGLSESSPEVDWNKTNRQLLFLVDSNNSETIKVHSADKGIQSKIWQQF